MDRRERVAAKRQAAVGLQARRQRVGPVADERQRRLDQLAQLRRRDLLARGVDRCEVGGRRAAVEVERAHCEAEAVRCAAEADVRAGLQLLLQPGLVEPRRADLAGPVGDLRGQDLEPAAAAPQGRAQHLALDQHLLVAEQVGDPPLRRRRLVPPRAVVEQVADPLEPELREALLQRRADARERVERGRQALRAEAAARGCPAVGRVHGGKTGQWPAHRPSIAPGPARAAGTRRSRPSPGRRGCRRRRRDSSRA